MQQHPKIEQMMEKLCNKLVKCEGSSGNSILKVFHETMLVAVAKQIASGEDAEWIIVRYMPKRTDSKRQRPEEASL